MTTTIQEGERPLTAVQVGRSPLSRFAGVLGRERYAAVEAGVREARRGLDGRTVWNVNSTARGGGVAEMLAPLLAYARDAGVDARWRVIAGDERFFAITKRLHNRLHGYEGDGGPLGEKERAAYEEALAPNARALHDVVGPRDAVILHDPQTAGMVPALRERGVPVVWRCHVGVDAPNDLARDAWAFLKPYAEAADAIVFSREAFEWDVLDHRHMLVIPPTIDVFAPKNQELGEDCVDAILGAAGLRHGGRDGRAAFTRLDGSESTVRRRGELIEERPLRAGEPYVLQVSRWDALKDPEGVIGGFAEHVAGRSDAHLIYAGPAVEAVSDDPEGAAVLAAAREQREALAPEARARVHLALLPMADLDENAAIVNALQRRAAVVVQKSLAEGFGLTVAEAMWKARPVVASRIGGIQDQIEDGRSGLLLDDPRDLGRFGAAVLELLEDRERAEAMGAAAQERVRDRFLGTHSLLSYLDLLRRVLG
jgi:trehalose synthase